MSYKKSIARKDFEVKIKDFKVLTRKTSRATNLVPYDIKQCVYRNAIFQCSACLEEYIKQLLTDWIDMLHRNNCSLASAPKELIYLAAGKIQRNSFNQFITDSDESKFIKSLTSINKLSLFFNNEIKVKEIIRHTEFVSDKKYPSLKNYKILFGRFGINNFFDQVNKEGNKNFSLILESFNNVRTSIAHEHPSPSITDVDVQTKLDDINNFVKSVDRMMYKHVKSISGDNCWKYGEN